MARRVIILGFDGLDPRLCRRYMADGALPNYARLAAAGAFRDLNTSVPCQSPVAWRTMITGVNPGVHGVFDFLRRKPGTYLPELSTAERISTPLLPRDWQRIALSLGAGLTGAAAVLGALTALGKWKDKPVSRRGFLAACAGLPVAALAGKALFSWTPRAVPSAENRTGGAPFWAALGRAGARTTALRIPVEFPARTYPNARVLSGLGVPDVRATNGTYTLFATDALAANDQNETEMGGRLVPLRFEDGRARLVLHGPPDPTDPNRPGGGKPIQLVLEARREGEGLAIAGAGMSFPADGARQPGRDGVLRLRPGESSRWLSFEFTANPLVSVCGRGRIVLLSLDPEVRVYVPPVQFDPAKLPANIALSSPKDYAGELATRYGSFPTLGWPTDTWARTEGHISDDLYLDDYRGTLARERDVTLGELERKDWDCLFAVFTPTDQAQHLFRPGTERGEAVVRQTYADADAILGEVLNRFGNDPSVTILAVSDHGFHPFDRAVNLNTWLWKNGYLRFRSEGGPESPPDMRMRNLYDQSLFWEGVDWTRTYAYSMGLGNIYFNLEGREPTGLVRPGDMAEAVKTKLREGLAAWRDDDGAPVVRTLYDAAETYRGPRTAEAADFVVGFYPGYRVSWQTSLGGTPPELIEANNRPWNNDHCSLDPAVTSGILFSNKPIRTASSGDGRNRMPGGGAWPSVMDVAPTVCRALGVDPPADYEGEAFL